MAAYQSPRTHHQGKLRNGREQGAKGRVELEGRIKLFDPDGSLAADCREIWTLIEPQQDAIAREFWVEYGRAPELKNPLERDQDRRDCRRRIVPYLEMRHCQSARSANGSSGPDSMSSAATSAGVPLTAIFAGSAALSAAAQRIIVEKTKRRPGTAAPA